MICAVHQPQYLPWLGFLAKLDAADLFVLYDDTQYKHDEWQNRNRIKTANGVQWLTVPVHHSRDERICDIRIDNSRAWRRKHLHALATSYGPAPHYEHFARELEALIEKPWDRLAELNVASIRLLCRMLGIETPMVLASELGYDGRATAALVSICQAAGADSYLSGPGGRDYLEAALFDAAGIRLLFHDFNHPVYPQQFGEFAANLSAVDLLFNCGPGSLAVLRSARSITCCSGAEPEEAL